MFGWTSYHQTGDANYRTIGDKVFAGGVKGAWLNGSKQFDRYVGQHQNQLHGPD